MLKITVPGAELFDESKEQFVYTKETTIELEHSLLAISKWETKWKVPFLSKNFEKTSEMIIDYIKCMTITKNVPNEVYLALSPENQKQVLDYIGDPATATTFYTFPGQDSKRPTEKIVTSELIYYYMVAAQIPFRPCETWNINRLMTLIKIYSIKNEPKKKMSKRDTIRMYKEINDQRMRQAKE